MFRTKEVIMINVWEYSDLGRVKVTCTDNQVFIGELTSIDDEEESGLGEDGISIFSESGQYIGIGQSEIESIQRLG